MTCGSRIRQAPRLPQAPSGSGSWYAPLPWLSPWSAWWCDYARCSAVLKQGGSWGCAASRPASQPDGGSGAAHAPATATGMLPTGACAALGASAARRTGCTAGDCAWRDWRPANYFRLQCPACLQLPARVWAARTARGTAGLLSAACQATDAAQRPASERHAVPRHLLPAARSMLSSDTRRAHNEAAPAGWLLASAQLAGMLRSAFSTAHD